MSLPHDLPAAPAPAMALREALAAAAAEMNREPLPSWLEHVTLARLPVQPEAAPARVGRRGFGGWPGAAALASVLLVSVLLLLSMPAPLPGGERAPARQPSGFLPLVSADTLAMAADSPAAAWLVATEMPRERLAALGLPFDPARAGDSVHAELLMNASGQVLAVRLLPE
jgi:hypothetical protein